MPPITRLSGTAHGGAYTGAPAAARRPWQPRLIAGSHRYFVRGGAEKPGPDDVRIKDPGAKRLAPYDHMLRKFQCAPPLLQIRTV